VRLATKQAAAAGQLEVLSSAPDDAFPFDLRVTVHLPQLPPAEREHLYVDAACGCRSVSRKYSALGSQAGRSPITPSDWSWSRRSRAEPPIGALA
jgi:hypothetical protein